LLLVTLILGDEPMPLYNYSINNESTSNPSIRRTGNDQLDLELIEKEISGSVIAVLAYIVLILSAYEDKRILFNRQRGLEPNSAVSPNRLVALSNSLVLIAYIIFGNVADRRYVEIVESESIEDTPLTPTPNLNISKGYNIAIVGCIFKVLGAMQRVNEEDIITLD
jgi:hypothetical protein